MNLHQNVMEYVLDGVIEKIVDLNVFEYGAVTMQRKLTVSFFCSVVKVSAILESDVLDVDISSTSGAP
jgi:hypothetical protein